jgi:L-Ala-D/L-Glu epimerase
MSLIISHEIMELRTRHAFNIARAAEPAARRSVWVRIRDDASGREGWGEAAANAYYGESADTVAAVLPAYERALATAGIADVLELERAEAAIENAVGRNPAARAAVSAALHDLAGKTHGLPVWRLWGLDAAVVPPSSFTIGIGSEDALRQKLEEAADYPILKLKVGTPEDRSLLEQVRKHAPAKTIRVDANTAWTAKQALALLPLLEELDIELIEQPFKAGDIAAFRLLREHSRIPIVADESCRVAADVPLLAGAVDGINIKLEKCGSLREALRLVHVARAHNLQVMVGCMLCTTLGIAAALQIGPLVDWVDLDGAALLAEDPFDGPRLQHDGRIRPSGEPGLGVRRSQD